MSGTLIAQRGTAPSGAALRHWDDPARMARVVEVRWGTFWRPKFRRFEVADVVMAAWRPGGPPLLTHDWDEVRAWEAAERAARRARRRRDRIRTRRTRRGY